MTYLHLMIIIDKQYNYSIYILYEKSSSENVKNRFIRVTKEGSIKLIRKNCSSVLFILSVLVLLLSKLLFWEVCSLL